MPKELLKEEGHICLYRDTDTGLAWVEDGSTGLGHSCHPNIDSTGSIKGMVGLGYWQETDKTVELHGFIYNISIFSVDNEDPNDLLAAEHCECEMCIERKAKEAAKYPPETPTQQELADHVFQAVQWFSRNKSVLATCAGWPKTDLDDVVDKILALHDALDL